jgi:tyrosine-protein kinase Etk/Wzc
VGDESHNTDKQPREGRRDHAPGEARRGVTLLDLLTVLAIRWKLIFFTTFFAAIGSVLFSIYTLRMPPDSPFNPLPNIYRPEAQILLTDPDSDGGLASSLGSSDLGLLAGLASMGSAQGEASAALARSLLEGNHIIDQIIEEFDILALYEGSDFPRTEARRAVRGAITAEFDELSGILTVSFQDIDPVFATDVLQEIVNLLEDRFTSLTRDDARARTVAIDNQLQQLEDDLTRARQAVASFQERYGVIDPANQGQQTLELIGQRRAQKFELEIQRETLLQLVENSEDPQIQRIERQITLLEELIDELETGFSVYSPISIPRNQIASLTAEYSDLRRDLVLKEQIFSTFQAELIRAQIGSQDTTRRFQVIEPPELPEMKDSPSRALLCIIVTFAVLLLSVMLAFILEYFARAGNDPAESWKIDLIKSQFRIRRPSKK